MPLAPATQPRPNIGIRFTSSRIPSRGTSRASTLGADIPVTEVNTIRSTSSGRTSASTSARRTADSASRVASATKRSFVCPNVSASRYSSSGSTR